MSAAAALLSTALLSTAPFSTEAFSTASLMGSPASAAALRSTASHTAAGPYAAAVRLTPPRIARSVFVLGDSLMVGVVDGRFVAGPSILEVLRADGVDATADARVARTIPQARAGLPPFAGQITNADTIVVGLGTNDIFNSGRLNVASWQSSIANLLDAITRINPTARVVWVDVSFPRVALRAAAFNRILHSFEVTDRLDVCPWHELISRHPEWLGSDRLHLRASGYAGRRDLILACIGPR